MKIVDKKTNKQKGKVLDIKQKNGQVSVLIQLMDEEEIAIYRKFLESENGKTCPKCGATNNIGADDYVLQIDNPFHSSSGIDIATPIMTCDNCGEKLNLSMLDYNAFPSVVGFIKALRKRESEIKEKGNGKTEQK